MSGGAVRPLGRGILWGVLVGVIVAVALATWISRRGGLTPEPPPVLAEVPPFELIDRHGSTVTRDDLLGEPWVADLVFTRCVLVCPVMSGKMAILDRELPRGGDGEPAVRLVSITVDPEHDRPPVLQEYAERFDASERWLFLTGERRDIVALATDGLRLGFDPEPRVEPLEPGDNIAHSTRFVLVDAEGRVRGYYETTEADELDLLRRDLAALE